MRSILRSIGPWLAVVASVTAGLAALDRVPSWLTGVPHGTWRYASLNDAEQALRARIWLPSFYPADLAWPPTAIVVLHGPPPVVLLRVASRSGDTEHLLIYQSLTVPVSASRRLLPAGQRLMSTPVTLGRHAGLLDSLFLEGGREVHDVTWEQGRRRITLRYAGPVETLLLMARSLERAHP